MEIFLCLFILLNVLLFVPKLEFREQIVVTKVVCRVSSAILIGIHGASVYNV